VIEADDTKLCYVKPTFPLAPLRREKIDASAKADARFPQPEALASRDAWNCAAHFSTCPTSHRGTTYGLLPTTYDPLPAGIRSSLANLRARHLNKEH